MRYNEVYKRRQSIGYLEALMLVASAVGFMSAVLVWLLHGWLLGLSVLLLSTICYALSRIFDLMSDLLGSVARMEEATKCPAKERSGP